jgi:hypothetical protein
MSRGLSDFVVTDKSGLLTVDSEKLSKLPDEEFRRRYNEDMEDYIRNHRRDPLCDECRNPVLAPESLVRFSGVNLHSLCFLGIYSTFRETLTPENRQYFDKILAVRSTPARI